MQSPLRIVRAPTGGFWHLPVDDLQIRDHAGRWHDVATVTTATADATHRRRVVAYVVGGQRVDPSDLAHVAPERLRIESRAASPTAPCSPAPAALGGEGGAGRPDRAPVRREAGVSGATISDARASRLHAIVGAYIKLVGLAETHGTFAQRALRAAGRPCPAPVRSFATLTEAEYRIVREACERVPEAAYIA